MITGATIYCRFDKYFWSANGITRYSQYNSTKKTHLSARQAADEVLEQMRSTTGQTDLTLQRRTGKVYDVLRKPSPPSRDTGKDTQ